MVTRIDLSAIGAKPKAKTATVYPELQGPRVADLATSIVQVSEKVEALTAKLDMDKAELRALALPQYFKHCAGRSEIPSSMAAKTVDGHQVLVTFQDRYKQPANEEQLRTVLGNDAQKYLRSEFKLEIDSTKIPEAVQQDLVTALVALLDSFDCKDALSAGSKLVPTESFHKERHRVFTPEKNAEIEAIMPMTAAVKTKGGSGR
jgi:hypothetical protein